MKLRAFTLIELLVVIAIIAILAAILFPVFAQAKNQALKAACSSNMNQIAKAIEMYKSDNGTRYPTSTYHPSTLGAPDLLWDQLIQPYTKSYGVLSCPIDPNQNAINLEQDVNGRPCKPNDNPCKLYGRAIRSNLGLSLQYISPLLAYPDAAVPIKDEQVEVKTKCILAVDSVLDRNPSSGKPEGGGLWLVDPPARIWHDPVSNRDIDTFPNHPSSRSFWYVGAWRITQPKDPRVYGANWPWHNGYANVIFVDTHAKALTIPQLAAGCDVRPEWMGRILDRDAYLWDLK
jgi:prepilin-type N-terminal cleavage/methylation domain-containing protein/prepilin-type processing-associated H-X9-DG protein